MRRPGDRNCADGDLLWGARSVCWPTAQCNCGGGGGGGFEPLSQTPPPPSNQAPRAGPTKSTAGRLKSLKHVILHVNLANAVHHPFFLALGTNKDRPCEPVFQTPPPLIHTEGPHSPGVVMDRGPFRRTFWALVLKRQDASKSGAPLAARARAPNPLSTEQQVLDPY